MLGHTYTVDLKHSSIQRDYESIVVIMLDSTVTVIMVTMVKVISIMI